MLACKVLPFGCCFLPESLNMVHFTRLVLSRENHDKVTFDVVCAPAAETTSPTPKHNTVNTSSAELKNLNGLSVLAHAPRCPARHSYFDRDEMLRSSGREQFPKLAACVAICYNGHILLTRRSMSMRAFPGVWVLPGGHVDPGEPVKVAAAREAMEEVNVNISPEKLEIIGVWESCFPIDPMEAPPKRHAVVLFFYYDMTTMSSETSEKELRKDASEPTKNQFPTVRLQEAECDKYAWVRLDPTKERYTEPPGSRVRHHFVGIPTEDEVAQGTIFMIHRLPSLLEAGGPRTELVEE